MYLCCLQTLLTRSSHSRMIYSQLLVPNFHPACVMQRQVIGEPALTTTLKVFYSADIVLNTALTCDGPICCVPELVAGSAAISLT